MMERERHIPPSGHARRKLVGIITDRDIKEASPSKATTLDVHELYYLLSELKVKDIMSRNIITCSPEDTVEKAAVIMLENNVSGIPILDSTGKLVGIISKGDVFKVLISITGIYRGGVQFAFNIPDKPGTIKQVADVIRAHGARMVSILTSYDSCEEDCRARLYPYHGYGTGEDSPRSPRSWMKTSYCSIRSRMS